LALKFVHRSLLLLDRMMIYQCDPLLFPKSSNRLQALVRHQKTLVHLNLQLTALNHSSILQIRRSCLPPSNSVFSHVSTISRARPCPITLSPIAKILESLCWRVAFAENVSCTNAQRMPFVLLAVILIPIPVPQIRIPLSYSPAATFSATGFA